VRLRAVLFQPAVSPRGSVVLSPGRTEPIEKYFEVVGELQARGFVVLVHDWRGQGMSDRLLPDSHRGHAVGWRSFLNDFDTLLHGFSPRLPGPWIALGHSMGGGLTALALVEGESRFAAAAFSAPMFGLDVGSQSRRAATVLARIMALGGTKSRVVLPVPDPMHLDFDANVLTHDESRFDRFSAQLKTEPALALGGVTWGWVDFAMQLERRLGRPGAVERLSIPMAIVAAGDERLVFNPAARRFAERARNTRFVEVKGAFHEILMETDARRAVFWAEFDNLAERVAPPLPG